MSAALQLLVLVGAPPARALPVLEQVMRDHAGAVATVYLRAADGAAYAPLLAGQRVRSDKPAGGKLDFLQELRADRYDAAILIDFGDWDFLPARVLFHAARADEKSVRSEQGTTIFAWLGPATWRFWMHRQRHRRGPVAGLPPGTPLPFLLAAYRYSFGMLFGAIAGLSRHLGRRVSM